MVLAKSESHCVVYLHLDVSPKTIVARNDERVPSISVMIRTKLYYTG